MTKGGVMMGSTVSTRNALVAENGVRVATSAKVRPSAVVLVPTRRPRNRVFQATPQPIADVRQSSPQISRLENFAQNSPGARAPLLSWTAATRIRATGKKTKTTTSAITTPIPPATKRSPLKNPFDASPMQNSISSAVTTTRAPMPIPGWPPTANPCRTTQEIPPPPATSSTAARTP
jgi:hypothetical protein